MDTTMNLQSISVDRLKPAKYKPSKDLKTGDPAYEKIKRSLQEFGYVDPVIWNEITGNIVGGHQRYKVLTAEGATEIDCVVVQIEDEQAEKALNIALNKEEDVNLLMAGVKANLAVTDPPYNVSYDSADSMSIQNDNMGDGEFYSVLFAAFRNMAAHMAEDSFAYIFHADTERLNFRRAFKDAGFHISGVCIWVKNAFDLWRSPYHWQHEPVCCPTANTNGSPTANSSAPNGKF